MQMLSQLSYRPSGRRRIARAGQGPRGRRRAPYDARMPPVPPRPLPAAPAIDLNADVGEGYGAWTMGDDAALLPHVTSANVACGGHAGDPAIMVATLRLAARLGVACGAHPGYPDRAGFGRRELPMDAEALHASLLAQLGALAAIARDAGVPLRHVKPHGALYHRAAHDPQVARTVVAACASVLPGRAILGPAGSALLHAAAAAGLPVRPEGFADRGYAADGGLVPRGQPGALLADPAAAAAQACAIARTGRAATADGGSVAVIAETLCIHGDSPGAPAIAAAVRAALHADGIRVAAPEGPG